MKLLKILIKINLLKKLKLKKLIKVAVLFTVIELVIFTVFKPPHASAAWFDDSWQYRKQLTVDHTKVSGSSNLTNFPVLVSRTDTDLSKAQADGDDILFTDAKGIKLDHEIETFTQASGVLDVWVKIPMLDADEPTVIYLYYGNPSAVNQQNAKKLWQGYVGVWHLDESITDEQTSGIHYDSSPYGNNGIQNNNGPATVQIGGGTAIDGTGDWVDLNNPSSVNFSDTDDFTITGWASINDISVVRTLFSKRADSSIPVNDPGFSVLIKQVTGELRFEVTDSAVDGDDILRLTGTTDLSTLGTFHFAAVFDNDNLSNTNIYVNGTDDTFEKDGEGGTDISVIGAPSSATNELMIGSQSDNGARWNGNADELRIYRGTKTSDWIATEYNNQDSPSTFFTTGSEEKGPAPAMYLKFDEGYGTNAYDSSANKNNGSISGSSWKSSEFCLSQNCLFFDGTDDVVTVTNADSVDFDLGLKSQVTFQTWARVNSDGENNVGEILDKGTNTYIRITNDGSDGFSDLEVSLDLGTTDATATITNGVTQNKWHHIAVTYTDDGDDEITVYIDGLAKTASTNGSGAPQTTDTNNILIGGSSTANFHGFIDEFKVYAEERTADEVKTDFLKSSSLHGSSAALGVKDESTLSNGLVGYWKMDDMGIDAEGETITDSSGNANSGTLYGDNSTGDNGSGLNCTATGKFGTGCDLDGTDDYIELPDSALYSPGSGNITVSVWVNLDTTGSTMTIYQDEGNTEENMVNLQYALNKFRFVLEDDNQNFIDLYSTTQPTTNTWYHVTGVREGKTTKIFVNGVLENSQSDVGLGTATTSGGGPPRIGDVYSGGVPWNGRLDSLRIYKRALSPIEVSQLYNWAPGPVGWWKLDENQGTTSIYDSSGNGYTGTMNSLPASVWTQGKYGSAIRFDNTSGHTITMGDVLDIGDSQDFTISGWVYSNGGASGDSVISKKTGNDAGAGYMVFINNNNKLTLDMGDGTDQFTIRCDPVLTDNIWIHFSWSVDEDTLATCYLNGVVTPTTIATGTLSSINDMGNSNTNSLTLGAESDNGNASNDIIDDIKIYNYAQFPVQVIEDMNAGHPAPGSPVGSPVGYWNFSEGYGTAAHDLSVNGNTLTLSSASWTNSGKFGKAFNGTGAIWATRTDDDDFDFAAADDLSISFWFKSDHTNNPSNAEYLLEKGTVTNTGTAGYAVYANTSGNIVFGVKDDTAWGASSPNTPSPDDTATSTADIYDASWHHITATKTGTTRIDLYVDGKLQASDTTIAATATLANAISLRLADDDADTANAFNGDLDEVKIYRSALTADQVKTEYNRGSSQVFGALSTDADGTATNSAVREYCPPGNTETNCASGSDPSPVAEWKFDERSGVSAFDTSGNGRTGTITNNPLWTSGKIGAGLEYDGVNSNDQYVRMSSTFDPSATDFTFEVCFKPYSYGDGTQRNVFQQMDSGGTGRTWVQLDTSGTIESVLGGVTRESGTTVTLNQWYHAVLIHNNSANTVDWYINGIKGTQGTGVNAESSTGDFLVGIHKGLTSEDFHGIIDNPTIYNYIRTPAQVAWDYNRGGPVARYKFDECSGSTAYDASGNSYNGTITPGASGNTAAGSCNSGTSTDMWNDGTTGKYNSALGFDGTDDYVDIGDRDFTSDITIAAWVKANALTIRSGFASKRTASENSGNWTFRFEDNGATGKLEWIIWSGVDTQQNVETNVGLTTDTWYHIALSFESSTNTTKIYINGTPYLTDTSITNNLANTAETVKIGYDGQQGYFNGLMDDVRLYNYILTPQQIKTVMNEGSAVRFGPLQGSP